MRKVANRLGVLEERYKDLPPKARADKINAELRNVFCVGSQEITNWKRIVNTMKQDTQNILCIGNDEIPKLSPTHYLEIAKLPEEKQPEIIEKVANENLNYRETALLVQETLEPPLQTIEWENTENVKLYNADFDSVIEIPESTIGAIITDPPYGQEFLPKWNVLGQFANRVLISGGFFISYSGQLYLPQILSSLNKHLSYFWTCCLPLSNRNLIQPRNIYNVWKPLLFFYKPPLVLPEKYFFDVISGSGREKNHHPWQQSEKELEQIIDYFVPKNGIILDPLAGSGTTLVAARKQNRKCIGIERDSETFETLKRRVLNGATS